MPIDLVNRNEFDSSIANPTPNNQRFDTKLPEIFAYQLRIFLSCLKHLSRFSIFLR